MMPCRRAISFLLMALILALLGALDLRSAAAAGSSPLQALNALNRDGKYALATAGARELLAKESSQSKPDSLQIAAILDVLVESLWRGGKAGQPETRELAQRAVDIRERRFGGGSPETAAALTSLGNVLYARNDYAGALPPLERAHSIQEVKLAPDDPVLATTLAALGSVLRSKGEYPAARPLIERALAIREKVLGPDHPDVASSLGTLGTLFGDLGDYAGARRSYERVIAIREKTLGPDHPLVASAYDNLGLVLRVTSDYAAARVAHERGLAIREKMLSPDDPAIANSLQNLGLVFRAMGSYSEARPLYERAARIREVALGPENPEYARAINNLANLLRDMGDDREARPLYERALAIREKTLGPDHPDLANTLDNFGLLLENTGDYVNARRHFERALAISRKKHGPDHTSVAIALWALAGAVERQGDLAQARTLYENSLATWERALGPRHTDIVLAMNGLAGVLMALGEHTAARRVCERGIAIRETLGTNHPKVAESLHRLGEIHMSAGDIAAAQSVLERALTIRETALGHQNPEVAATLYLLARARAVEGARVDALAQALEAETIAREHLRITARGLAERQALLYDAVRPRGLDIALSLAARGIDGPSRRRVLDALVHSRALVLDEMAARHSAVSASSDSAGVRRLADLMQARERLAALLVRGVSGNAVEAYRRQVDDARTATDVAERGLARVSEGFAREQSRIRSGLDEVAVSLPAGSALVAVTQYQRIDLSTARDRLKGDVLHDRSDVPSYLAFVLRAGDRDPTIVDLGPAAAIDARVERWRKDASASGAFAVASTERPSQVSGTALRKAVWDPIASAIGDAARVFVVPDGSLNLVNFAALPAKGDGFVIEHGPLIHIASAERDLVAASTVRRGNGMLAIGAVDYEGASKPAIASRRPLPVASANLAGSTPAALAATENYRGPRAECGDLAAARFEALPATGTETREIVALWNRAGGDRGAATELRDGAADENTFKKSAKGHRVLHLATHGFFLGECQAAHASTRGIGGLDETPAPRTTLAPKVASPPEARVNPLRLSGLVLAGANHRAEVAVGEEDGILTSEEIASIDLSGTEWVVLSACETGVGDVHAGEGVFGLRRGFQIAGAGTLIMSLWSVDDESTRAWMKALYQSRLERGLDTAESVRQASLEVLKQRRATGQSTHPFYWAAFIGAGDWR